MFAFSIVKPPFSFTDVKAITIPTICSVNKSGCYEQCMYFENACIAHNYETSSHNQNEQVQYVYHCCLCLIFKSLTL